MYKRYSPSPWRRPLVGGKYECISAGMSLQRDWESFQPATPVLNKDSISWNQLAWTIPHSDFAIAAGAAGKEILAFFMTRSMAFVAYEDGASCGYTKGLIKELLSPELEGLQFLYPEL
jgi:hypothetical protein